MTQHLEWIGVLLIVLACVHAVFPSYFDWKNDLRPLQQINRQVMYVHTFFIALTVGLMGLLCLLAADELVSTPLGRMISVGLGIFWGCRLFAQFFVYSSELWRGKRFETLVHIVFSATWIYLTGVFLWVGFG
ncbi:hypothetical protein [Bradymonas sediminis]|uniref:Uncharacterized protein n=1 Tax=Bradymonas sediminis TaxID=1548548 RepID=A0A2Z4FNI0_9DELT|nr:hypothetical protein [Bradymonas sediminis]AWV90286.1 hypothetical protein DN745_13470 [Bradymonas sediminis]TDP75746.1 hypothetical protein DFR33_10385 [Bradymonas sediminis]